MIVMSRLEILAGLLALPGLFLLTAWGAGMGHLWWPSVIITVLLAAACWRAGPLWWKVAALIALGAACACVVDGSLNKIGLVRYIGGDPGLPLPPLWIIALWALLAAVLALPARRLLTSPMLAGVAGAIAGPLAYAAARQFGAIATSDVGLAVVGTSFALATPILVLAANAALPIATPEPSLRGRR